METDRDRRLAKLVLSHPSPPRHDDLVDLHRYACEKTKSLDLNGDGEITESEFIKSIQHDKVYRDLLWSSLPPVPSSIRQERLVPLSLTMRKAAQARADGEGRPQAADVVIVQMLMDLRADLLMYTQSGTALFQMEFDQFFHAVVKIFGADIAAHRGDAEEVFAYFADLANELKGESGRSLPGPDDADEDASSRALRPPPKCNIRLPWAVLARACAGVDTKFKAHLLAALVNDTTTTESRGMVARSEIQRFLDEMKAAAESLSTHAVKVLDDMDEDGNGKLDMTELKSVIFDNPSVLHCMSALQMYNNDPDHDPTAASSRRGSRPSLLKSLEVQSSTGRHHNEDSETGAKSQRSARRPSEFDIKIPEDLRAKHAGLLESSESLLADPGPAAP